MRISFIYGLKSMNMPELQILAGKYAIKGSANWWSALEVNAKLLQMIHVVCFCLIRPLIICNFRTYILTKVIDLCLKLYICYFGLKKI